MLNKNEVIVVFGESRPDVSDRIAAKMSEAGMKFSSGEGCWNNEHEKVFFVRTPNDYLELTRVLNIGINHDQDAVCILTATGYGFVHLLNDKWESTVKPTGDPEIDTLMHLFNGPCGKLHIVDKVTALSKPCWFCMNGVFFLIGSGNFANLSEEGVTSADTAVSNK